MNCGMIATVTERSEEMPVVQSSIFVTLRFATAPGLRPQARFGAQPPEGAALGAEMKVLRLRRRYPPVILPELGQNDSPL